MTIGSLAVNITATTDKFQKGLAAAKSGLGKFVSGIGAAQAAVAGFVTYGLASVVTGAIEAGSSLFEMTQKLNVSAEALSALHFAADQLESSAGAVDNAIAFMTKTLGKAAQGSDPAIAAFNNLNIDFEKLQGLAVDKQFLSIVDALHKIPDPAERAAAAQGIFGRGAKELAALIAAGTDEIIKQGEEAGKTGNILSTETVAALDEAGDAVKRLTGSWSAAKTTLVGEFAPELVSFVDLLYGVGGAIKFVAHAFQYVWTTALKAAADAIYYLLTAWNALAPKFLEADTGGFAAISEDLGKMKGNLVEKMGTDFGGTAVDNPLAKSAANVSGHVTTAAEEKAAAKVEKEAAKQTAKDKKEEEKKTAANTKKTTEQLQELINYNKQRGPVLKVAGVR